MNTMILWSLVPVCFECGSEGNELLSPAFYVKGKWILFKVRPTKSSILWLEYRKKNDNIMYEGINNTLFVGGEICKHCSLDLQQQLS